MKILITSEVHGKIKLFTEIINKHQDVGLHINAGDLQLSEYDVNKIEMVAVRGNTDVFSNLPLSKIITFNNKKILVVHGHQFDVKYSLDKLINYATLKKVDICIFGHTHVPYNQVINNIHFINPGAIDHFTPTYALYEDGEVTHLTL